jgi:hypothetical protein
MQLKSVESPRRTAAESTFGALGVETVPRDLENGSRGSAPDAPSRAADESLVRGTQERPARMPRSDWTSIAACSIQPAPTRYSRKCWSRCAYRFPPWLTRQRGSRRRSASA